MSLPKAQISHALAHRLRIRIPSKRKETPFFAKIESELEQCSEVDSVRSNPLTGSILLSYQGDMAAIKDYAQERGLFELDLKLPIESTPSETLSERIRTTLKQIDQNMSQSSGGSIDLSSILFTGLLGATFFQIYRGRLFPPAVTLIDTAIRLLKSSELKSSLKPK